MGGVKERIVELEKSVNHLLQMMLMANQPRNQNLPLMSENRIKKHSYLVDVLQRFGVDQWTMDVNVARFY